MERQRLKGIFFFLYLIHEVEVTTLWEGLLGWRALVEEN